MGGDKYTMPINIIPVNIGELPNDGTGDPLRTAFDKLNTTTSALANIGAGGSVEGAIQFKSGSGFDSSANLIVDTGIPAVVTGIDILPELGSQVSIGSSTQAFDKLYLGNDALRLGNLSVTGNVNTLTFKVTSNSSVSSTSLVAGNFSGNTLVSYGNTVINGTTHGTSQVATTVNNTTNQIIFETSALNVKSAIFKITTRDNANVDSQFCTLHATFSSVYGARHSASGTIFSGLPLTRYNMDIGYGNIRVMVTPLYNITMTHTVVYEIET